MKPIKPTLICLHSLTEVVIINILVKPRLFHDMRHKGRKQVLLRLGGQVYYGVLKRQRTRLSASFKRSDTSMAYRAVHFVLPLKAFTVWVFFKTCFVNVFS